MRPGHRRALLGGNPGRCVSHTRCGNRTRRAALKRHQWRRSAREMIEDFASSSDLEAEAQAWQGSPICHLMLEALGLEARELAAAIGRDRERKPRLSRGAQGPGQLSAGRARHRTAQRSCAHSPEFIPGLVRLNLLNQVGGDWEGRQPEPGTAAPPGPAQLCTQPRMNSGPGAAIPAETGWWWLGGRVSPALNDLAHVNETAQQRIGEQTDFVSPGRSSVQDPLWSCRVIDGLSSLMYWPTELGFLTEIPILDRMSIIAGGDPPLAGSCERSTCLAACSSCGVDPAPFPNTTSGLR